MKNEVKKVAVTIDNPEALVEKMEAMKAAQRIFATYTQEQVDRIFKAAATAADKMRIFITPGSVFEVNKIRQSLEKSIF